MQSYSYIAGVAEQMPTRSNAMIANELLARRLQGRLAELIDPRRDINKECGYPSTTDITSQMYRLLYERDPIAGRVVDIKSRACWAIQPSLFEEEDSETDTEFEVAWNELSRQLNTQSWYKEEGGSPIWEYLARADERCGIGHYGIILLGLGDEDMSKPAPGVEEVNSAPNGFKGEGNNRTEVRNKAQGPYCLITNKKAEGGGERKMYYIRVSDESMAPVSQWEANPTSPRFGQPTMYQVTFHDPSLNQTGLGISNVTQNVHWTRVIHVADELGSSEVIGAPRVLPVFNHIYNLQKIYGASGEGYWQQAFAGLSLEGMPGVQIEPGDLDRVRSSLEAYTNGLQRYLVNQGATLKQLSPQVSDPASQVNVNIQAICIKIEVPMRIFMGSERGELASSQDERDWQGKCQHRRVTWVTPRLVVPFVDRLIMLGILPVPKGYGCKWEAKEDLTPLERMDLLAKRTAAYAAYVQGGLDALIPPLDFMTKFDELTKKDAMSILDNATLQAEAEADAQAEAAEEAAVQGLNPDGTPIQQAPPAPGSQQQPPKPGQPGQSQEQKGQPPKGPGKVATCTPNEDDEKGE